MNFSKSISTSFTMKHTARTQSARRPFAAAQIFNLSVSPEIVARRATFPERGCVRSTSRSTPRLHRALETAAAGPEDTAALLWLRLGRAALYRRIAFCAPFKAAARLAKSDALPIGNRRYSRLQTCATMLAVTLLAGSSILAAGAAPEQANEPKLVRLKPEVLKEFAVETAVAGPDELSKEVQLPGEVRLNENNVAHIVPRFAGVVTEIRKNLGDPVEKGEVMAVIESNDSLVPYELKSLVKGTVIQKHIALGEVRDLSTDAFVVADLSTVWVDLNIYQKDIGLIREGQAARIIAPHGLGIATNKISYVGPSVSESTRTGLARVVLPNPDRKWLPGLFITGRVIVEAKEYPLVIPLSAIQKVEDAEVVFVKEQVGFKPVPVKLGERNSTHAEVLAGLTRGQTYVAKGSFVLKSELEKASFVPED